MVQKLGSGQITTEEYDAAFTERAGAFAFNMAFMAVAAGAGRGRASVIGEGAAEAAARRSPLRGTLGRIGERLGEFKGRVGERLGEIRGRMKEAWASSERAPEYSGVRVTPEGFEVGGGMPDFGRPGRFIKNLFESRGTGGSGGGGPKGWISYGELDALGRPTGVEALITKDMINTGSDASQSIKPPGWSGDGIKYNEARGHLLGNQLGGSGAVKENLVTIQQRPANTPFMRGFENQVRRAVEAGESVRYSVTTSYKGANLAPQGITISARGTGGFSLDVTILNPPGR